MKIENKNVINVIDNITTQQEFKAVLLYGEDDSSVLNKYNIILNSFINKKYELNDISQENIKNNPTYLSENFFTTSMFLTNTIYTLRLIDKENEFTKYIEILFETEEVKNVDNFLLITAGNLDTKSSLRKYAEKSKYIACIGCYEESNPESFISNKLKEYGFVFNNSMVNYILQNVGTNTTMIQNEIEKLSLYKIDDKILTIDDLKECIKDISNNKLDDFCNNFCSMYTQETIKIAKKLMNNGVDVITLTRVLIKYFLQLQKIKEYLKKGETIDNVFKYEKIFWKQQHIMKNHLSKWDINNINKMLYKLLDLEKRIKFDVNKNIIFEHFILKSLLFFNKNNN